MARCVACGQYTDGAVTLYTVAMCWRCREDRYNDDALDAERESINGDY